MGNDDRAMLARISLEDLLSGLVPRGRDGGERSEARARPRMQVYDPDVRFIHVPPAMSARSMNEGPAC